MVRQRHRVGRLYDPSHGRITWDGVDLRAIDPDQLRERIGAVFQDYVEYELSAAENIGVGNLAALSDRGRIEAAARRAGIHDTLAALPAGYDTLLTRMYTDSDDRDNPDTGVLLSGGQGQRLALARTFARAERDLLILDEPSSGLDAEAEASIHRQLRTHRAGRTSLLISHRLNTVRDADLIVVLAGGQVSEQGDHASLVGTGGTYARLFAAGVMGWNHGVMADAQPDTVREQAREPNDIAKLLLARMNAGDIDGVVALYESEAVLALPDGQVAVGSEAIRAFFEKALAGRPTMARGQQRPALISGDLALTSTRTARGTVTAEVARRQPDGSWLWVADQPDVQ